MSIFFAEFIGTMMMLLLGTSVVANVLLNKTKGQNSGWIVITTGWAMAVFVGVYISASVSGAHLNPAISIALFVHGKIGLNVLFTYIAAQFAGAMAGAFLAWLAYKQHFDVHENGEEIRAVFCTAPAIRNTKYNLLTEIIGTFALMFGALKITSSAQYLGSVDALPVAFLVLGIGLSLGGSTGYAINPARDLGARIVHALLPIKNKTHNDWGYAWIPVVGPIIGALLAVGLDMLKLF
jgi:glycerol uptake facilitator protein